MLWQQVNQPSHSRHASTQTHLHTSSYLAPRIYPVRSHTSALLPQTHWICTWAKQYVSTDGKCEIMSLNLQHICMLCSTIFLHRRVLWQNKCSETNISCSLFCLSPLRVSGKIRPTSAWAFTLNSVREPCCFSWEFTSQPGQRRRTNLRARHLHSSRQKLKQRLAVLNLISSIREGKGTCRERITEIKAWQSQAVRYMSSWHWCIPQHI